jgi:CheY-like chemotaxis protein
MRILIAEDDATSRFLLQATLKQWNYEVTETSDGPEAWEKLQQEDAHHGRH